MGLKPGQTTSTSFKEGNTAWNVVGAKPPGRPAGVPNKPNQLEVIVKKHYKALADIFDEDGIQRLMDDIETLPMRDQVQAKLTLLEYVKPKLARLEVNERKEVKVISIFGQRVDVGGNVEDAEVVEESSENGPEQ